MTGRTVYLAGPYSSRETLKEYGAQLTRIGYKVRARWLDGQHEVSTNPVVEALADPAARAQWANEDLADIRAADVLIAFTSAAAGTPGAGMSGGRHVETGYALASGSGVDVILVGEPENVFHWLPQITRVPDWHEALIELSARLVAHVSDMPRDAVRAS